MKIGVYGGTFDPVHNGHIQTAEIIMRELSLDRIYFVAACDTPLKESESETSGVLRFKMLKSALKNKKDLLASDVELKRGGKSYTVDTLEYFREQFPDAEIFFIVGGDRLADFSQWHCPEKIMRFCSLAAVRRRETAKDYSALAADIEKRFGGRVYVSEAYGPDISSTLIRERIYNALPVSQLMPFEAELILYENALYFPKEIRSIYEKLGKCLNEYRLKHTMLTVREAIELGFRHGADTKKARLAAILHDCVKFDTPAMIDYAGKHGFELTDEELMNPYLIHARMGAMAAEKVYGINDPEIINAIARHTLGSADMTTLDKVIYLADKLEPSRQYRKINVLKQLACQDLDSAVIAVMRHTVNYTKSSGRTIHPSTMGIIAALENKKAKNKIQYKNGGD